MYKTARKRERQGQTLRFIRDVSSFATHVIYGATYLGTSGFNEFMRFPSVIDMHMAGDQCRRHMFV